MFIWISSRLGILFTLKKWIHWKHINCMELFYTNKILGIYVWFGTIFISNANKINQLDSEYSLDRTSDVSRIQDICYLQQWSLTTRVPGVFWLDHPSEACLRPKYRWARFLSPWWVRWVTPLDFGGLSRTLKQGLLKLSPVQLSKCPTFPAAGLSSSSTVFRVF